MKTKTEIGTIKNTGNRVQLYYDPDGDYWYARSNIKGLKIDMTVKGKKGHPFYPGLPLKVTVT